MMSKKKPSSKSYDVGYARPPKKFRFRRGKSGNPSGKRRKASAPDLKAQLQSALNETVTIRSGKHPKVMSKGAAGIDQLVDQFAAGDRNARRDLFALCEKFGVDILWNGPAQETEFDRQMQIVDSMIAQHVDGLAVAAAERNALNRSLDRAAHAVSEVGGFQVQPTGPAPGSIWRSRRSRRQ